MRLKLFLFAFIISSLILQFSLAIDSNEEQANVTVSSIVEEQIQDQGRSDVIVLVKDDAGDVLNTLSNEISNEKELDVIEGFSATINDNGLDKLKENPDVIAVEPVIYLTPFLTESVPLINASVVHSLQINGINITGKDQTVCILDTGVNYNHADLGVGFGASYKVIAGVDLVNDDNDPLDDQGHGTHVSGIVGAKGNLTGVAPDAKIVAVKVCNNGSSPSCSSADILDGIQWCNDNKNNYNITVISMSLGGNAYNDYCDASFPVTVSKINESIAKNITVVASTGNSGSSVNVAYPSCIRNIIAVGATAKNDSIADYSNGNNITDLLAPGSYINSTYFDGSYTIMSGTSMATPHVSGSVALMQQYYKEKFNRVLRPSEVESLLKSTGLQVLDSRNSLNSSSLNFSRINVSGAINQPLVDLNYPINNSFLAVNISDFNFTAFDNNDTSLNCTIYINGTSNNALTASVNTLNGSKIGNITEGEHTWYVECQDHDSNIGKSVINTLEIDLTYPIINITSPLNNSFLNYDTIVFNYSLSELNPSTCNLYGNWTNNWHLNQTKDVTQGNNNFTATLLNGNYLWNVKCTDLAGNYNSSYNNFTIRIDFIPPNLTVISPINNAYYGTSTIFLNYTYGNDAVNLSYVLNDTGTRVYLPMDGSNVNLTGIVEGNHTLNVSANDSLNNINSSLIKFVVDLTKPSIVLNSPDNGATSTSSSVTFKYTVTDLGIKNCMLLVDGNQKGDTDTSISSGVQDQFVVTLDNSNYEWQVRCTDKVDNINTSISRDLTVSVSSSSGGLSSSSGGTTSTTTPTETPKTTTTLEPKPKSKYNIDFSLDNNGKTAGKPGEERTFSFDGTHEHKIKFDKISFSLKTATVTLQSDPVTVELKLKEPKEVDLNKDNINDIVVNLVILTPDDEAQLELSKIEAGAKIIVEQEKEAPITTQATSTNITNATTNQSLLSRLTGFFSYNTFKDITGALSYQNLKDNKETVIPISAIALVVVAFLTYRYIYLKKNLKFRKIRPQTIKRQAVRKHLVNPLEYFSRFISKIKSKIKPAFTTSQETKSRLRKIEEEEKKLEEENQRLKEMVERMIKR